MTRINVQIDELVLTGFDHHDRTRIGMALERELAALIRERGLREGLAEERSGDRHAPSFNVPADLNPKTIGFEAARSIYRKLVARPDKPQ